MKKIAIAAAVMLLGSSGAWAAGTAAGTQIDNSATLNYSVSGTAQDAKTSNTDTFYVDQKINFTVSHDYPTIKKVQPNTTDQVLSFTVTNTGNKVQDFSLTSTAGDGNPYGETDNTDMDNIRIVVDTDGDGVYTAADTDTYIDELAPDDSIKVFILADIASTKTDGQVAEYTLTAQVAQGGTSGTKGSNITSDDSASADTAGTAATDIQIVFADGDGNGATDGDKDGKHADYSAYKVVTATLALTKLSCVIEDGVTSDNTKAKRIPGATIAYVFDVENTGSADADSVTIADDLAAELDQTNVTVHELYTDSNDACTCVNGSGNGAETGTHATAPSNDQTNHDVEINIGTVTHGTHSCLEIRVPIL
jgi:hypothetical protein